ncbi:MAG: hypothetical protein JJT76_15455, partial [Clostridiaceae bacterium]|nr:hypothetical protein [Clostridiaceae bacterium]
MSTEVKQAQAKKRKWEMPDSYVIIFCVVILAALATYVIPLGQFDVLYKAYDAQGNEIVEVMDGEASEFTVGGDTYTIDSTGGSTEIFKAGEEDAIGNIRKNRARAVEVTDGEALKFTVLQEYGDYISSGEKEGIKLFEKWGGVGFLNYAFE